MSEPGWYHIVSWYEDGTFRCEQKTDGESILPCFCEISRAKTGKDCRHIRIVKNHFNGLTYDEENDQL